MGNEASVGNEGEKVDWGYTEFPQKEIDIFNVLCCIKTISRLGQYCGL